jgi:hypothetical protein
LIFIDQMKQVECVLSEQHLVLASEPTQGTQYRARVVVFDI